MLSLALIQIAAERAHTLRAQVGAYDMATPPAHASKQIMMLALRAADTSLLLSLTAIDEGERETRPVCGDWTASMLIGHIADWDAYFLAWLSATLGNASPQLEMEDNLDTLNARLQAQRGSSDWQINWRDFQSNRAQLLGQLDAVPADAFLATRTAGRYATVYHLAWSALEHVLEHAADVRRACGLALPESLLAFHGPYTG